MYVPGRLQRRDAGDADAALPRRRRIGVALGRWFPLADAFGVVCSRRTRATSAAGTRCLATGDPMWSSSPAPCGRPSVAGQSTGTGCASPASPTAPRTPFRLASGAGDVFSHVAAFSPGLMTPRDARGTPRIFISHGTSDAVMPIDETSRKFVPALKKLGYDVTYQEYEGGTFVPEPVVREAFAWFAK